MKETAVLVDMMKTGKISRIVDFDEAMQGAKEYQVLDAILLMCFTVPEQRELIRTIYSRWRTLHFNLETQSPVQVNKDSNYEGAPAYPTTAFRVDDYIKLEGLNTESQSLLLKWGAWWRVDGGYKTGKEWLLQSIAEQKRTMPKKTFHQLTIGRTSDWNYAVVKVKVFPSETTRPVKE